MKDDTIAFKVGGMTLGFRIRSRPMRDRLRVHYRTCMVNHQSANIWIKVVFGANRSGTSRQARVWCQGEESKASRSDFECTWSDHVGTARIHPAVASFDSCIRSVFATELPRRNGLLLHAAGVVHRGCALVFAGVSGTGKTTIARFSKGRKVLSDEMIALRVKSGKVRVSATPFWGELGTGPYYPGLFPLKAIIFPCKASSHELVQLGLGDAVARLLRSVCTFGRSSKQAGQILELAAHVVSCVPVYEMRFRKDAGFWEVLSGL